MPVIQTCPQCGTTLSADAPEGLCPRCLLQRGAETDDPNVSTPEIRSGFVPPDPSELAKHFPGLEVLELLGRGGMGVVYKARQSKLNRLVALKILPPDSGRDPAFAERFSREAQALARLNHPNIVAIHEFGETNGYYYFLMEYVDGMNLRQLGRAKRLKVEEALGIVPGICDALQYAHEEGVVHRDIKPENILLDKRGRVKIADFGISRVLAQATAQYTLTGRQEVLGTPRYMAPEQMERPDTVDHRADIYSLGVVFYEMLTGEVPVGRFALPSERVRVDVRLDEVVLHALEKEPELRYQQASQVKTDVEFISRSSPPASHPPGAPGTSTDQIRRSVRHPAIALLFTAGFNWIGSSIAILFLAYLSLSFAGAPDDNPGPVFIPIALLIFATSAFMLLGAIKMLRLQSYPLAVTASILAMVVTPGNLVGLPLGIWAFVVLMRPEVKAAFKRSEP
jgi:serine/threonine protein kinase